MRGSLRDRLRRGCVCLACFVAALVFPGPAAAQERVVVQDLSGQERANTSQGAEAPRPGWDAASAPNATGTQAPATDLNSMSIEELMEIEVQTVESASRYRQKVSEAPASITIITAEDIRKYGYRTLADILRSVRGFYTTSDRNYDYIGVRGFGRLGDYNTRILLMIDGHRMNDVLYDSAPIGTEFPLDIDLIDHVEVTRGPGSSLYGSNAFFGVVNVVTRRSMGAQNGEISAEAASFGTYQGRLTYGAPATADRELLGSISGFTSAGDRLYFREYDQRYPLADVRATNNGYADHGDYARSWNAYGAFEQDGLRLSGAYSERTKGIPTAPYGTDFNEPRNRTIDERGYADLQYRLHTDRGDEYTGRVYFDQYWYEGDYLYTGTVNKDRAAATWYGGELRGMTRLNVHRLVAGVEGELRERQDQWNGDVVPPTVLLDDRRRSRTSAVYVQDEITVAPSFLLYAGVRHDEVSTFGGSTNPRLAAIFKPAENNTIKALYGRAFRAPSVYELYYEVPPSVRSNPALQPETIDTYELVYEYETGKRLNATTSLYRYVSRDLITQTYDAASGSTSYQNLKKAEATGLEMEVQKSWDNGASGSVRYSYQVTEDPGTGEPLANAPRYLAGLNLSLPVVAERCWVGLEELYTGPRRTLAGARTDAVALTNLTLLARNRARTVEFSLSVYNLLDTSYADPVSIDLFPLDTVQQDGRTVRAKVIYAF